MCLTKIKESILISMMLYSNQSWQNMVMAKDVFIMCFVLSCVGNVIFDSLGTKKNPEEMMGPSIFETIEKRVAEMIDIRVTEMENRVVQVMSKLKDEIKRELAFDMAEECKKINERKENGAVNKRENYDKIINEDLRQNLKEELMTELNHFFCTAPSCP